MEDNTNTTKEQEVDNNPNLLILWISLGVVCVVFIVVCVVVYLSRRRSCVKEEPEMEENLDYGEYEEYYDEHNNRVVDNNDYYE